MIRIKICCIASVEEARLAIAEGANAIGLVSAMPSGAGVIPEERIPSIAAVVPPGVSSFLLTSRVTADTIIPQQKRCGVNTLQLVDRVAADELRELRAALPGVSLVQVIHVRGDAARREAKDVAPLVDALLLDSGNPDLPVKELGGTGRVHDWSISERIVREVAVPVFLAGGLREDNVRAAIDAVHPWGVDVCSGLRPAGALDPARLRGFVARVREAAA